MSHDVPEFDYESHFMGVGKKIFYLVIGILFSLGFGVLWYAIITGGTLGMLLGLIGGGATLSALVFGILLPLLHCKR